MAFLSRQGRLVVVAAGILAAVAAAYVGYRLLAGAQERAPYGAAPGDRQGPKKQMANRVPEKELVALPPAPAYAPDAPVLQQVRDAFKKGIRPAEAVRMAAALPESPERADAAFLLLEYAAEAGSAEAAAMMGRYYDPTDPIPSGTIRKSPASAFRWYRRALAAGATEVESNLADLRQWVRQKAEQGSTEAQQLLDDWEKRS